MITKVLIIYISLAIQLTFCYLRVCQIVLVSSILRWALFSFPLPRAIHLSLDGLMSQHTTQQSHHDINNFQ